MPVIKQYYMSCKEKGIRLQKEYEGALHERKEVWDGVNSNDTQLEGVLK